MKTSAFLLCALAAVGLIAFQNCGLGSDAFKVAALDASTLGSIDGTINPNGDVPPTSTPVVNPAATGDRLVNNCFMEGNFDGCVFAKNPVAQQGAPISTATPWYDALAPMQRYGFTLKGLNASGNLENASLKVMGSGDTTTEQNARLTKSTTEQWRHRVNAETTAATKGGRATQVSSYYWLSWFIDALESSPLIGSNYTANKGLRVLPYVKTFKSQPWANAAFSYNVSVPAENNVIIIGYGATGNMPLAFAADVIIHEFSHALLYHGTNAAATQLSTSTHHYCLDYDSRIPAATVPQTGVCCVSQSGCISAMNEGLADYFASMSFPSNPTIGESYMNDPAGFTTCQAGTPRRDVRVNAARTPASVFELCKRNVNFNGTVEQLAARGEIYTMASVYTSILWEIRKNMNTQIPSITVGGQTITGAALADAIVYEHMASLSGTSTFASSRLALRNAATTLVSTYSLSLPTGANLTKIIDDEFARRGVN